MEACGRCVGTRTEAVACRLFLTQDPSPQSPGKRNLCATDTAAQSRLTEVRRVAWKQQAGVVSSFGFLLGSDDHTAFYFRYHRVWRNRWRIFASSFE